MLLTQLYTSIALFRLQWDFHHFVALSLHLCIGPVFNFCHRLLPVFASLGELALQLPLLFWITMCLSYWILCALIYIIRWEASWLGTLREILLMDPWEGFWNNRGHIRVLSWTEIHIFLKNLEPMDLPIVNPLLFKSVTSNMDIRHPFHKPKYPNMD